jgi:hypothetical protein
MAMLLPSIAHSTHQERRTLELTHNIDRIHLGIFRRPIVRFAACLTPYLASLPRLLILLHPDKLRARERKNATGHVLDPSQVAVKQDTTGGTP